MNSNEHNTMFKLLGELSADVKHILSALDTSKKAIEHLENKVQDDHERLAARLTKVERFNTRILAYASMAGVVVIPVINVGIQWLFE